MQKQLKMGIMATFVAAALSGCGEQPTDSFSYAGLGGEPETSYTATSPEQCSSIGAGTVEECQTAFNHAKLDHLENAPKFADKEACEAGTDAVCNTTRIANSDGTFSDVFVPAMVGMIVGQMLSNNSRPMPVYAPSRVDDRKNGFVTSGGAYVPPGKGSVGSNTFKSSKSGFVKPVASSRPVMVSRGGFGKSGSFGGSTG